MLSSFPQMWPMIHYLRKILRISPLFAVSLLVALNAAKAEGESVTLKNPTFTDTGGDGMPDQWDGYPGGDGIQVEENGVRIVDSSESKGLGIAQWVPVASGKRYTVSVDASGEGGLFIYLFFLEEIPGKAKDIDRLALKQKRVWVTGGGDSVRTTTLTEIAPPGTAWARLWLYSPNGGTTQVKIEEISLSVEDLAPAPTVVRTDEGAAVDGGLIQNPTMAEIGADGVPVDWEYYPAPNGADTRITQTPEGIQLTDSSKRKGVGILQWVPVEEGVRYAFNAEVTGHKGLFLYVEFVSGRPRLASQYADVKLDSKREWVKEGKVAKVSTVAPKGAKYARVWLYSASSGLCDIVVKQITGQEEILSGDALAVASGLFGWMDFETGDFSQASSKEGGNRTIVKKGEGPVREGKYSYSANLVHGKERTELVGPRSPEYGVARYGWSMYVPEDFDADTFFTIVTQWHDWGTGKEYPEDGGAPTHLYISKGQWRFKLRHQGEGDGSLQDHPV